MRRMSSFSPKISWMTITAGRGAVARAETGAARRLARQARQGGLLLLRDRLHAKPAQDRLLVAAGVGVQLLVQAVEALDRVGEHAGGDRPRAPGKRHRHVEGLARVAERGHALEKEATGAPAVPRPERVAGPRLHLPEEPVHARQVHAA